MIWLSFGRHFVVGILRRKQKLKSHGADLTSAPQNCPKTVPWHILQISISKTGPEY